jgi:hypothetical protein
LKKEFGSIKQKSNYQNLLKKFFKLPSFLQKMNYSAQENILRENFKFLDGIMCPLGDEVWPMFKNLLNLVETMKPGSLIEICKLAISEKLDSISENLSKKIVEKELILIVDKFFLAVGPSTTVKVKLSTLKVFCKVLARLEPKQRETYADVYHSALQSDKLKWRFRLIIVSQMETLLNLFSLQKVNDFFMPMIIKFCMDECYVVRRNASASFWVLYRRIKEGDLEIVKQMIDINFLYFADYNRFSFRQSFIYMSEGILLNCKRLFTEEAAQKLLVLSKDPVINVRLSLAKLIQAVRESRIKVEGMWFEECEQNLAVFEDPDVVKILGDSRKKLDISSGKISVSANSEESGANLKHPSIPENNKEDKETKKEEEEMKGDIQENESEKGEKEGTGSEGNGTNETDQNKDKEGFLVIGESKEKEGLLQGEEDDVDVLSDEEGQPKESDDFVEISENKNVNEGNKD